MRVTRVAGMTCRTRPGVKIGVLGDGCFTIDTLQFST